MANKLKKVGYVLFCSFLLVTFYTCTNSVNQAHNQSGYKDGFAVGKNLLCYPNISNIIEANWTNEHYAEGYAEGIEVGVLSCKGQLQLQ